MVIKNIYSYTKEEKLVYSTEKPEEGVEYTEFKKYIADDGKILINKDGLWGNIIEMPYDEVFDEIDYEDFLKEQADNADQSTEDFEEMGYV